MAVEIFTGSKGHLTLFASIWAGMFFVVTAMYRSEPVEGAILVDLLEIASSAKVLLARETRILYRR